jgi:hypothetical protein
MGGGFDLFKPSTWGDVVNAIGQTAQDFANSSVGHIILQAVASSAFGPFSAVLGPQLGSIAFALPGIVRGERFDQAYFKELAFRLTELASIMAPQVAGVVGDQIKTVAQRLGVNQFLVDMVNRGEETLQTLADRFPFAREDSINAALELVKRTPVGEAAARYIDPKTYVQDIWNRNKGMVAGEVQKIVDGELARVKFFDPSTGKQIFPSPADTAPPYASLGPAYLAGRSALAAAEEQHLAVQALINDRQSHFGAFLRADVAPAPPTAGETLALSRARARAVSERALEVATSSSSRAVLFGGGAVALAGVGALLFKGMLGHWPWKGLL